MKQKLFTGELNILGYDPKICIRTLDLGNAIHIWCGVDSAKGGALGDLIASVPLTVKGKAPTYELPVSLLVASDDVHPNVRDEAESLSRLLTNKLGKFVLLSWNIPFPEQGGVPMDQRAVLQKAVVDFCQQLQMKS